MHLPLSREAILFKTQNALSSPCKIEPEMALAPHVCRQLVASRFNATLVQPQQMTCTLDSGLQRWAMESLRQHLLALQGQNVHDGAVLVADNATGEILAYVGNNGDQASARFVDGTQARRQAGSILKPFLYGLAIDTRLLTTASLLDDAPLDVSAPNGIYRPENYDRQFHGRVTARTALASSLNIPAVKVLGLLGVDGAMYGSVGYVLPAAVASGIDPLEPNRKFASPGIGRCPISCAVHSIGNSDVPMQLDLYRS